MEAVQTKRRRNSKRKREESQMKNKISSAVFYIKNRLKGRKNNQYGLKNCHFLFVIENCNQNADL